MTKEEIEGGVNALFCLAPQQQPQPEEPQEPTDEASSNDLLGTLEEETRQAAEAYRAKRRPGRPVTTGYNSRKEKDRAPDGYERATAIVHRVKMAKVKEIARREQLTIKEVWEAMMDLAIAAYEAKNGAIYLGERKPGDASTLFKM